MYIVFLPIAPKINIFLAKLNIIPIFAAVTPTNKNHNPMKHKLLSIFHLFLFTVFASAQGHYASVLWDETSFLSVSGHPEGTIVRGWNSQ